MAVNYTFIRQEAEDLVDLLEKNPDYQLHDHTAFDMAKELREMFGMCSFEAEQENKKRVESSPRQTIELNVICYESPEIFPIREKTDKEKAEYWESRCEKLSANLFKLTGKWP